MSDGHGHGHGHAVAADSSVRARRAVAAVLVPCALATLVALILLWPGRVHAAHAAAGGTRALGTVTAVAAHTCTAAGCGTAAVEITSGPGRGAAQTVDIPRGPGAVTLAVGAKVVLLYYPDAVPGGRSYTVVDAQRSTAMLILVGLCAAAVVAFGRWRGLMSLAGLAVSFALVLFFVLPAIVHGSPPLLVAVVGSAAIMFAATYLTQGISVHTSVAVAGTLASLVLTGLLGTGFTAALHLSGLGDEDTASLPTTFGGIDLRGLLLAGIVIGALGVLTDVTVGQAVTVAELAPGHPTRRGLYQAAARVGRAHVGTAVTTIILAYAGTSLPLLLLIISAGGPLGDLLTSEFVGEEVLRTAVGTIGLVASVPITTALAVLVANHPPAAAQAVAGRHARAS